MPRAPLHARGVTLRVEVSTTSSADITPPSSLIRTHAPIRNPPHASGNPSYTRSLQVAVSPCWESDLPGVVSANLSSRAWTPTPAALVVHLPVSSHKTTAFPTLGSGRRDRFRDHSYTPTAISVGSLLRGCSHSLMFRPVGLLATPIAPTAVSRCSGSSRSPLGFGGCPIAFALARSPTPFVFLEIPATPWAAVTSTSAPISVCYLPEQRIC